MHSTIGKLSKIDVWKIRQHRSRRAKGTSESKEGGSAIRCKVEGCVVLLGCLPREVPSLVQSVVKWKVL